MDFHLFGVSIKFEVESEEEEMKRISVWGHKFWSGFSPRYPGVFLVLLNILVTIIYLCIYVLLPIYYGSFSSTHNAAYFVFFVSNFLIILTGVLVIGFLTADETSLIRCIFVFIAHFLCFATGLAALIMFHIPPTNSEMRRFVGNYFHEYQRTPRLMAELEMQRSCCGVRGISDFFVGKRKVRVLPHSCCKRRRRFNNSCGDFRRNPLRVNDGWKIKDVLASDDFNGKGCFMGNLTFADLSSLSPSVHTSFSLITNMAWVNFLLISTLTGIFAYHVFYKLPLEPDRPAWSGRMACCIKLCCPKKMFVTASNHDLRRNSWRSSADKVRSKMGGDGEEDELIFEQSELYVGPPIKPIPPGHTDHLPNVSDVGSLVSSTGSESGRNSRVI